MSRRAPLLAALLLAVPLIDAAFQPVAASEVVVAGPTCTVLYSPAEREEMLAHSGVFAANWSAEILRDVPAAEEDMARVRSWHADKTPDQLADVPEAVAEAAERIDVAADRAGYRQGEALAPLRMLVERNDLRASSRPWDILNRGEARDRLAASSDGRTPVLLTGSRRGLSVAAEESWLRAWERTPGALAESDASRAELSLCSTGTNGSVNRDTAESDRDEQGVLQLPGVPLGRVHSAFVLSLLEDVGSIPESFR